jgi:hypothetical protein
LHKKSGKDTIEMLIKERNIDWNSLPENLKSGNCIVKVLKQYESALGIKQHNYYRSEWEVKDIPFDFMKDREEIEKMFIFE